jgi:hypothetical protein
MVGDDDGRAPNRDSLEVARVHPEADVERLEQAPGESRPGSTLPGVLEAVPHFGRNEEFVPGGRQRLRPGAQRLGENRWHGERNLRRGGVHGTEVRTNPVTLL